MNMVFLHESHKDPTVTWNHWTWWSSKAAILQHWYYSETNDKTNFNEYISCVGEGVLAYSTTSSVDPENQKENLIQHNSLAGVSLNNLVLDILKQMATWKKIPEDN